MKKNNGLDKDREAFDKKLDKAIDKALKESPLRKQMSGQKKKPAPKKKSK